MKVESLALPGAHVVTLEPRGDARGYFKRSYDASIFASHGLSTEWVQDNESLSVHKGVIRGLHFQRPPHAETKLVRCGRGAILDTIVDIRRGSPTYGQHVSVELSADNHKVLYVPKGFAHGFCTLEPNSLVLYKVDAYYAPEAEGGLHYNCPSLRLDWPTDNPVVSEKDKKWPSLDAFDSPFSY